MVADLSNDQRLLLRRDLVAHLVDHNMNFSTASRSSHADLQ